MKKLLFTLTLSVALAFGSQSAFAQAKKKPAVPAVPEAPAVDPAKAVEAAKGKVAKPLPMHTHVDTIDAAGKSFTHKNKTGVEVKNVMTATSEIKNGDKTATFADIKVGDWVSGLHLKKSDTEYEVVKITKFGPEEKKAAKPDAKPGTEPKKK